jgi:hypothetical protein
MNVSGQKRKEKSVFTKLGIDVRGYFCKNSSLVFVHPWWNWQTRKIQVLMPRGVGVQIPPGAPYFPDAPIVYRLGHQVLILERGVRLPLGVPFVGQRSSVGRAVHS